MPEHDSQFELSTGSNFAYNFKYEESDKQSITPFTVPANLDGDFID